MCKRTKVEENLINSINNHLRLFKVKDESNELLVWACHYLLSINKYEGFGFFKDYEYKGEVYKISARPNEVEYFQLY